jgi:predicted Zn-dependent protease
VAALEPGHSQTLAAVEMARTLFPKDDAEARERVDGLFRRACDHQPANPVLARAASEHFRTSGRLPEAIEMLAAHTAADPSSLALRIRLGILMLAAERTEEGEKALLDVLAIDSRQALAHQSLAKLYRKLDRVSEARPHAAEALKIRGGDPSEFVALADEFLAADLPREARLLLEKAVFFNPSDAALLVKLAIAARRDPESRGAASRLFREAESMSGQDGPAADPEFLREFAESLLEGGQTKAAEERLRLAIRAYPAEKKKETAAALRRLAGVWTAEQRNTEAANALLQRADSLDPP